MGHYYSEMCCPDCKRIPCTCKRTTESQITSGKAESIDTPEFRNLVDAWLRGTVNSDWSYDVAATWANLIAHIEAVREKDREGMVERQAFEAMAADRNAHRERAEYAEGMADSMRMFRKDMIEAGIIGESVPPMFMTEAILGALGKLEAERDHFKAIAERQAADGNWPKDFHDVIKGAEDAAYQQGRAAGIEEAAKLIDKEASWAKTLGAVLRYQGNASAIRALAAQQALLSPAQQEPAKDTIVKAALETIEGVRGASSDCTFPACVCTGESVITCFGKAASATDAVDCPICDGHGAHHYPDGEWKCKCTACKGTGIQQTVSAQTTPSLPSTPDEVIAFIGSNFDSSHTQGEKADWRYHVSVHDLLSAFSEWQDFPVAQATPEGGQDLPPLPKHKGHVEYGMPGERVARMENAYTADQMRDYARAALAANQKPRIVNEGNASAFLEEKLWEFIDTAGNFPKAKPNDRTWDHVLVYMPEHLKATQQAAEPDAFKEAYMEFSRKTDWVQTEVQSGMIGAWALGMHRADVIKRLVDEYRAAPPQQVDTNGLPG